MAHPKRRRPKNRRAGCLYCKPHKHQRAKDSFESQTTQEKKAILAERGDRQWSSAKDRPYSIQERSLDPDGKPSTIWGGEWSTHKRYHTKEARDQALTVLRRKIHCYAPSLGGTPQYEYRVGKTRT